MKRFGVISLMVVLCAFAGMAQSTGQQTAAKRNSVISPAGAGKYDTKLPIEISSDSLEVLQHENKAIFKGNVVSVQGQLRLKSDIMVVHYRQKQDDGSKLKPQPAPEQGQAAPNEMGAISRIDVEGNVFMASPEESAKGDKGDYDVDNKTIHLFGDNVILTRDKNILRGTALEYNLETGRSLLTNGNKVVNGNSDGRVRGVFVPNDTPSKAQKPAQTQSGQATGNSNTK